VKAAAAATATHRLGLRTDACPFCLERERSNPVFDIVRARSDRQPRPVPDQRTHTATPVELGEVRPQPPVSRLRVWT
jgi:hypothetical protein